MPRYFIDTSDADNVCRDEEGMEYADLDAAKAMALRALLEIARDEVARRSKANFGAIIRDGSGQPVLRAALSLEVSPVLLG